MASILYGRVLAADEDRRVSPTPCDCNGSSLHESHGLILEPTVRTEFVSRALRRAIAARSVLTRPPFILSSWPPHAHSHPLYIVDRLSCILSESTPVPGHRPCRLCLVLSLLAPESPLASLLSIHPLEPMCTPFGTVHHVATANFDDVGVDALAIACMGA
ncbi:hypothetical protein BD414DRAFT_62787 [Trametes punicea]|nr:hypothetical protein BD414DRAFT_62787 [Trametes punicea]